LVTWQKDVDSSDTDGGENSVKSWGAGILDRRVEPFALEMSSEVIDNRQALLVIISLRNYLTRAVVEVVVVVD